MSYKIKKNCSLVVLLCCELSHLIPFNKSISTVKNFAQPFRRNRKIIPPKSYWNILSFSAITCQSQNGVNGSIQADAKAQSKQWMFIILFNSIKYLSYSLLSPARNHFYGVQHEYFQCMCVCAWGGRGGGARARM